MLGLLSVNSNAQEQFLKLDSIQVIYGTLNKVQDQFDPRLRIGRDTLNIVTNSSSIIKLKSFLMEIDLNPGQGSWNNSTYTAAFTFKLNNRCLKELPQNSISQYDRIHLEYFEIIENGEMNLDIQGISRVSSTATYKNTFEFHYRIELHHYSYE